MNPLLQEIILIRNTIGRDSEMKVSFSFSTILVQKLKRATQYLVAL